MSEEIKKNQKIEEIETNEWLYSLDYVLEHGGPERVIELLRELQVRAFKAGVHIPFSANTPYINTIPREKQSPFPGNREIERRIKSLIRWNAMAMVVKANKQEHGIGGHISTYASAATLYEIGFNHFFRGRGEGYEGDQIYFQGHASPGFYARAFLEGRITKEQLINFRRDLAPGGGLTSYPHPFLMPDFWEFPTVSMGLGPIQAIYRARFNRYLEDRELKKPGGKVWAFLGDGETDEPETLGAITLASREKLDNLIFVINANLQRLDGPVRGNGKIIQELEAIFRGAGWHVIKVVWGGDWDPLLEKDTDGKLVKRMGEVVDGEYQKYSVEGGAYIRKNFFGKDEDLLKMVEQMSDEELFKMKRGGHDPEKVYAAYKEAVNYVGKPTVIIAKTIKGYGLGEAGEGKNITHQQKKLNEDEMKEFRSRFGIPISDERIANDPFYKPDDNSEEIQYIKKRREELGGYLPSRKTDIRPIKTPPESLFEEFYKGTEGHEVSTTMVFVRILAKLLKDKEIGKLIVPIVPDEARTFGMEALFRQVGIYSHSGQLYEPVDAASLLYYKEAKDGQILEEGITEAGSMSSFMAAGTAYLTHGINMIPFFVYYSMFGLQRVGDLVWAAADMGAKGFLFGGTAGRTTLAGEGLQHQDGNSHLLAYPVPNLVTYDPAFAYEIAVIIRDGIKRMFEDQENIFYYVTLMNENYAMPEMPKGVKDGILKGMYKFKASDKKTFKLKAQLLGSGTILNEVIKAAKILEEDYRVACDIWSVTSYKELRRDALEIERWNMLNPTKEQKQNYIQRTLQKENGVFVAASDYVKALPDSVAKWFPGYLYSMGTDGFGRSESRAMLREFFEVDAKHIVFAALTALFKEGKIQDKVLDKAGKELGINPNKRNPLNS
ncbi:MAG: pyruvate dehydrogenase (acetyl-transferring), homodimeric type [Ignavibacteriota bacterium]|jgi:pyruvate dehydrogenase E1 component|nr:MAG: pyruvate dehydrogenase (acetyl-transferring), homodimeric type [Ignavibacterium sp.]MBL1154800.1 pyruvate dehydrogenase (acetyl-transferring), homodimeric type [Ignavibacteriota bacterium]MCO6448288.1 pyruvate dehydrogenase (acetyl-transferring), homodimeric type [Ignavibacterium album]MCZ2268550.1 pyruvate dehydrogenase (acetyl-transferring), homodimeric type [Ignavibacteriales bacterium]MDX9713481.1 pyruvate dehydrogenase (acetyl-transferring), homodimeric type [Ignavibacteriaceae bac